MRIYKKRRYSIAIALVLCLGLFMPVNVYAFNNEVHYLTTSEATKEYKIKKKDMKALVKVMKKLGIPKKYIDITDYKKDVFTINYLDNSYTATVKRGKVKLVNQGDFILYKKGEVYQKITNAYITNSDKIGIHESVENAVNENVGVQCTFQDYEEWDYRRAENIFTIRGQAEANGTTYNFEVRAIWDRMHSHPITIDSVTLQ